MALICTEDRGAVRHLVLNRPEKRNALNGELIRELAAAVEAAAADDSVRVVVLRGEGAMFSSGMDLNDLRDLSENPENVRAGRRLILACWNLLEEMPKPTICQIQGAALGGAFELALACDMRTMAEDAMAGILEVRVGLLPDLGGCSRLPAVVGLGNAKELIMTGKVIDGREAHRIGFANRIAPADGLDEATGAPAADPVRAVLAEGTPAALANHVALVARDGRRIPVADSAAPISSPRRSGGDADTSHAIPADHMHAPPTPWMKRAVSSSTTVWANANPRLDSPSMESPSSSVGFTPQRVASQPEGSAPTNVPAG